MILLRRGPALRNFLRESANHLVRMPRVTAAITSIESGPPTSTGRPFGTDRQNDVGRLTGKLHELTIEPSRPADEPPMLTVLLPVTMVPLWSGSSLGANFRPG